jgi:hypothetical protein
VVTCALASTKGKADEPDEEEYDSRDPKQMDGEAETDHQQYD